MYRVFFSPYHSPHLLSVDTLTGVIQYLTVVFIAIFQMHAAAENLFICLLPISISSLDKYSFRLHAHFQIESFLVVVLLEFLVCMACKYSLSLSGWVSRLADWFAAQKFLIDVSPIYLFFLLLDITKTNVIKAFPHDFFSHSGAISDLTCIELFRVDCCTR